MIKPGTTRRGFFKVLAGAIAAMVVPIRAIPADDRVKGYDPASVRVTIAGIEIEPSTYMED